MTTRELVALALVLLGLVAAVVGATRLDPDLGLAVGGTLALWIGLRVGDA